MLALASGAKTVKMGHGHHGANHPVQDLDTGVVMITSQNHGFAVDEATLPGNVRAIHKSLFDGTLQVSSVPTRARSASRATLKRAQADRRRATVRSFHRCHGQAPLSILLQAPGRHARRRLTQIVQSGLPTDPGFE